MNNYNIILSEIKHIDSKEDRLKYFAILNQLVKKSYELKVYDNSHFYDDISAGILIWRINKDEYCVGEMTMVGNYVTTYTHELNQEEAVANEIGVVDTLDLDSHTEILNFLRKTSNLLQNFR